MLLYQMLAGEKSYAEFPVPPLVLSKKVKVKLLRREHTKYFIHVPLRTTRHEPSDTEELEHLNLWARRDMPIYIWVDANIVGTPSILNTEVSLGDTNIMVGDFLEWLVLLMSGKKRICNSFDNCAVPFMRACLQEMDFGIPFLNSN